MAVLRKQINSDKVGYYMLSEERLGQEPKAKRPIGWMRQDRQIFVTCPRCRRIMRLEKGHFKSVTGTNILVTPICAVCLHCRGHSYLALKGKVPKVSGNVRYSGSCCDYCDEDDVIDDLFPGHDWAWCLGCMHPIFQ